MDDLWQIDANRSRMGIAREYVTIGGDLVVGSLLSQIVYWHRPVHGKSKLRIERDGYQWVAKTQEEWMEECCLTWKQYRRALDTLKAMKLVEVRQMKFGGKNTTHFRLLERNLLEALKELKGQTGDLPNVKPSLTQTSNSGCQKVNLLDTETTTESTTESTNSESASPLAVFQPGAESCKTPTKSKNSGLENLSLLNPTPLIASSHCTEGTMPTAKETLAMLSSSKAASTASLTTDSASTVRASSNSLAKVWRSMMSVLYPDLYQHPLTQKELGQFKKFATDAPDFAIPALKFLMEEWGNFAQEVKLMSGVEHIAMKPSIDFLLKHRQVGVNLYLQSIAPSTSHLVVKKPTTPAASPSLVTKPKEAPYKPSQEEIDALLEELK